MKLVQFLVGIIKLFMISFLASMLFSVNPYAVLALLIVLSCIVPLPKGVALGVVLETWAPYIMTRFWKDNAFLRNVYDDSQFVQYGRIVHIPQPGSKPNVVINRANFPGVAVRRADTDTLYALDEATTDPTHIPNIDAIQLSYNKADSILGDHMGVMDETIADIMLQKWAANATIYRTTGETIVNGNKTTLSVGPVDGGQVGNRLAFTHRDLKNLMTKFNTTNVPKNDRFVLIDDNMFDAFYDTLGETNAKDFSRFMDAQNGVIGKLHSFSIMTRSSVMASDNADAIKALGSAMADSDNLVSLAWQKNSIAFALGDKKLFQDLNNPLYYGDIHSALVMFGGRVRRADGLGIFKIIQGVPEA